MNKVGICISLYQDNSLFRFSEVPSIGKLVCILVRSAPRGVWLEPGQSVVDREQQVEEGEEGEDGEGGRGEEGHEQR